MLSAPLVASDGFSGGVAILTGFWQAALYCFTEINSEYNCHCNIAGMIVLNVATTAVPCRGYIDFADAGPSPPVLCPSNKGHSREDTSREGTQIPVSTVKPVLKTT